MASSRGASFRQSLNRQNQRKSMTDRGWCEVMIPSHVLNSLSIPYEVVKTTTRVGPGALLYAPAWVYAVWHLSRFKTRWEQLAVELGSIKDDAAERELMTAELALNEELPLSVRRAARIYARTFEEPDDPDDDNDS